MANVSLKGAEEASGFRVAVTGDFRASDGSLYFEPDALAHLRSVSGLTVEFLDGPVGATMSADVLTAFDAVIMKRSPVTAASLQAGSRVIHIARNGVGTEHFDIPACTRAGIMITNTPESVRRPTASSAMTMILALAHKLPQKSRMPVEGRWTDRHLVRGIGLTDRVLGLVGCGNIGSELLRLARPWEMEMLVADPHQTPDRVASLGARLVDLDIVLEKADFLVLCCPLTDATRHIIDAAAIRRMKPDAHIINVARGPLIEEAALTRALTEGRLAGAGLDVFDPEPPAPDNPLLRMENVIATAHNLGFSDEGNRVGNLVTASCVAAVARRQVPANLINPEVLDHARVRRFLAGDAEH